ncbi:NB-ARC domain-containing protein [Cognatiyoonia sp. IB215182]|uniref:NB-ARC domain-containing protein n=1 Tax=Cognatiyoonia sp. IB215182 TaxID=3097353 RepID=UPI002A16D3F2|nr:NB-ARC domain-containing protein [Cognatiyoonia sp. IB215182]MDX8353975.1 NB-ARC domain-containing protein [Cognatiyoonia sp. IB215182]
MATLDGEFLEYMVFKTAGHTNQSRIAPKITNETTLSLWFSGKQMPRDGSLRTIAAYVFEELKRQKDKTEYFNAEQDFISATHFLRQCQAGERSIDDSPPLYAFEFLTKRKNLLDHLGRITDPAKLQHLLSHRSADLRPEKVQGPEKVDGAKLAGAKQLDFIAPTPDCVARPKKFEEIKSALLATGSKTRNVALTTVLHGFGGFGKTTLAKEIYNDPVVRASFTDGVFWVQCQQSLTLKPEAIVGSFLDVFAPDRDKGAISDPVTAKRELMRAIGDKHMLLVVDDVWYDAHAEIFRGLPPSCVVLMTTRMKHLAPDGMSAIFVDAMQPDEAFSLLANLQYDDKQVKLSNAEIADLKRLAKRLGYWAQLLALANGRIRTSFRNGGALSDVVSDYLSLLDKRGIVVADSRDLSGSANEARAIAMRLCVDASLEMLNDRELHHFEALGVLPKDADIPVHVVTDYWKKGKETVADEGRELLEVFADMSLLQLTLGENGQVALHDNIIDYLARRMDDETKRRSHQSMVDAIARHCGGKWETLATDHQYGWNFLLAHLEAADQRDLADDCRTDFRWLKGKLNAVGVQELYRSFIPEPKRADAAKAGRAIALSLAVISKRRNEFASQLYGRLGHHDLARLKAIANAAHEDPDCFPSPLRPHLSPIGSEKMRFVGHHRTVNGAVFSKDGRYIVTASDDSTARLWDTETGAEIRSFKGHQSIVFSAVFSKDGRHVLTASSDSTARLWDTETGAEIRSFKGHEDDVMIAAFSEDGRYVITASDDRMARLWDTNTGAEIRRFGGHQGGVRSAVFSKDGRYVLTASTDRTARLWDTETGAVIRSFEGHDGWVWSAVFSKDGRHVLTASTDRTARLWDTATGAEIRSFKGHDGWVWSAVFSKDGRHVLTASTDRTARLWDTATGAEIRSFKGHDDWVRSAVFSEDSRYILIASDDRTARLWDTEASGETPSFKGQDGVIRSAVFSEDGRHVLTASSDSTARLWDTKTGAEIRCFKGHKDEVMSAVFSEDASSILTASEDGIARLWDTKTGAEIRCFKGHQGGVFSAVFSKDGRYVLTASGDRTARLWGAKTGAEIRCFKSHDGFVHSAVFSEDGRHALTASEDFKARLWDIETGVEIRCFKGHDGQVLSAILSRDGRHVLTASTDRTARLWDAKTGAEVRSFKGHKRPVVSAVFSKVGCHILTASTDGTARLWDAETGAEVRSFKGYLGRGPSAVFSKDGRHVLTASEDGTARLWDASTGTLLHMLTLDSVPTALATYNENLSVGTASGQLFFFSF